jgi:hypothetical protein
MGVSAGSNSKSMDLSAVLAGGDEFTQRLASLSEAEKKLANATKEFNLGRSAVDAYSDAARKSEEAVSALASANEKSASILAEARAEASRMLASAQSDHERLTSAASKAISDARETAAAIIQDAEQKVASVLASGKGAEKAMALKVDAMRQEAETNFHAASEARAAAEAVLKKLEVQCRDAEQAGLAHAKAKDKFETLVARVRAAIGNEA